MSAVVERALAASLERDYSVQVTRALVRMALDADNVSGENCVTSRVRVHEAAGYADDPDDERDGQLRYRAATRTIKRLEADGVIRRDYGVEGIGRTFTVCPTKAWSGVVSTKSALGRKLACQLAAERADAGVPEPHVAGASTPETRDRTRDHGLSRVDEETRDRTRDRTRDHGLSRDQGTRGPEDQVVGSPAVGVGGRAGASERANNLSLEGNGNGGPDDGIEEDLAVFVEHIVGVLQRGIDGLTGDEPCRRPRREEIAAALREHDPSKETALGVAIEVRSIAQAQNRAPNITGLFAGKLAAAVRQEAAA